MTGESAEKEPRERAAVLLEIVRDLSLELHPHKAAGLRVALDSSLDQELGFDSLSRVELLTRIEQAFGVALPEHVLASVETPSDVLQAMEGAGAAGALSGPARESMGAGMEALTVGDVDATPDRAATLVEALEWHVEHHPERTHVSLVGERDEAENLNYGDLLERSRKLAAGLAALDLKPGGTVAIMLPTGMGYFYSFMGTLIAGAIPVPIYPPARLTQLEDHLRRHAGILENARAEVLITVPEAKLAARLLKMQVLSLSHIVSVDDLMGEGEQPFRPVLKGSDIAHLQYTSGSTGNPKGVVLTHDNLLANIRAMGSNLEADSTDVFVSWLPLYHDMGLIGAWLGSLYFATPLVLMSPLHFLVKPERWLWAIHNHGGSLSGGPNFAYELCLHRIEESSIEGLDLSSWRVAFNGAEPVIPATLRRFQERFGPYGLRADASAPVYGLAESSVGLAFPPLGRGALIDRVSREALNNEGRAVPQEAGKQGDEPGALEFVACGQPLPGHEARIVNEAGQELGEREEGRLEFRGPSSTSGYYRNPEETRRLLRGGWLDSGDNAYIAGGDIYLTGRRKDIIIRAGRNIYPHELEEAIGGLEGVRKGCVAVFGATDQASGTERLVALVESREKRPEQLAELRLAIEALAVDLLGNPVDDVVVAPPHSVPKTSSGKIRRASCRELYEKGGLGSGPRSLWMQVLRVWLAGFAPQLRRFRRLIGGMLYGGYWLLLLLLLVPPGWALVGLMPRRSWSWRVFRIFGRLLLSLTRTGLHVRGGENLPRGQPCVLVVNHASYMDGLFLGLAIPGLWSFVAKRELVGNFFTRVFLKRLGSQFVERFDKQRGAADARRVAVSAARGNSLIFFPEGTFRRQPGLLPFHMGAFLAAAEAGVPVVPVVMRGTRSILRDGQWFPRRGQVVVRICPPISPEGRDWNASVRLRDLTRAEMLRHYGEPDLAGQPVVTKKEE